MTDQGLEKEVKPAGRSRGRSLFGPVFLIGVGVIFLLDNLNLIAPVDWTVVWRYWPLLLIFIGLNILAVQVRHPAGTILSLFVSLAAVGVLVYLLFFSPTTAATGTAAVSGRAANLEVQSFAFPATGVESAGITIEASDFPTTIDPLTDSSNLIEGQATTYGDLKFDAALQNGEATIELGVDGDQWMRWLDPATWTNVATQGEWEIGISPDVPGRLRFDQGNGSADLALRELTLAGLRLDGGNGRLSATLPNGDYETRLDVGNGGVDLTLPTGGRPEVEVDGGNGSLNLYLPAGMEARVEFEDGDGGVSVDGRFSLVEGDRDEGVYETAGYESAADRVLIRIDGGNGSVRVSSR